LRYRSLGAPWLPLLRQRRGLRDPRDRPAKLVSGEIRAGTTIGTDGIRLAIMTGKRRPGIKAGKVMTSLVLRGNIAPPTAILEE